MNIKNKISILYLALLVSCSKEAPVEYSYEHIHINPKENVDVKFSEIFEVENIILIDSSKLVVNVNKAEITHDRFILHCDGKNSQLIIKNIATEKIVTINNKGDGPDDYKGLTDYIFDEEQSQILILDAIGSKILKYDLNGKHLQTINSKHLVFAKSFFYLGENIFGVYGGSSFYGGENHKLIYLDLNTNEVTNRHFEIKQNQAKFMHFMERSNFSKDSLFFNKYDNFLYQISKNTIGKKYFIDFGSFALPDFILEKEFADVREFVSFCRETQYAFGVSNILHSENVIFFTFEFDSEIVHVYYNIKTGRSLTFNKLTNDLFGSFISEKTSFGNIPIGIWNNKFIFQVSPYEAKINLEQLRNQYSDTDWKTFYEKNKIFVSLIDSIDADSNPMFFVAGLNLNKI
jgi:hypothetical protein